MTNNEIVEYVYNTDHINIKQLINNVIAYSLNDGSDDDLEQYIYMKLLETDNDKLNYLYEHKLLGHYINRMVFNQRNYYRSNYNLYYKIKLTPDFEYIEAVNEKDLKYDDHSNRELLEFVDYMLNDKYDFRNFDKFSNIDKIKYGALQIYKTYTDKKRKHTIDTLCVSLRLSRNVVVDLIKYAKEIIRIEYEKKMSE